jgi:hypothetical protein
MHWLINYCTINKWKPITLLADVKKNGNWSENRLVLAHQWCWTMYNTNLKAPIKYSIGNYISDSEEMKFWKNYVKWHCLWADPLIFSHPKNSSIQYDMCKADIHLHTIIKVICTKFKNQFNEVQFQSFIVPTNKTMQTAQYRTLCYWHWINMWSPNTAISFIKVVK